jgi:hypothetical protein
MIGDGKAVGLIPDAIEEMKKGGIFPQMKGFLELRMKNLLFRLPRS